jgi:hypothetical protein
LFIVGVYVIAGSADDVARELGDDRRRTTAVSC